MSKDKEKEQTLPATTQSDKMISELPIDVDDDIPQYLKQYVKNHPTNKMAWYLLGKEYERQGKEGKALYCYSLSEEVYEAFEKKSFLPPKEEVPQHSEKNRWQSARPLVALLLLLGLIAIAPSAGKWSVSEKLIAEGESTEPPVAAVPSPENGNPHAEQQEQAAAQIVLLADPTRGEAARHILVPDVGRYTVWGLLPSHDHWLLWGGSVRPLASMRPAEEQGKWTAEYYDGQLCDCRPADSDEAEREIENWMSRQEQLLVLRSSIAAFAAGYGELPLSAEQLSGNYPENRLSGLTQEMREAFDSIVKEQRDEEGPSSNGEDLPVPASAYHPVQLEEPLEIRVDVNNYRLALVSGDVIIRNYPVGLGGERTPEGEFVISEKVVNPRGQNKGEFGSRGMTLSDTLYAIHGTNQPSSIEEDRSLGCVRVLEEDLQELYAMVPIGTRVVIGQDPLPEDIIRADKPFMLPIEHNEENPDKIYRWLN